MINNQHLQFYNSTFKRKKKKGKNSEEVYIWISLFLHLSFATRQPLALLNELHQCTCVHFHTKKKKKNELYRGISSKTVLISVSLPCVNWMILLAHFFFPPWISFIFTISMTVSPSRVKWHLLKLQDHRPIPAVSTADFTHGFTQPPAFSSLKS